jgi:hypothetical protein
MDISIFLSKFRTTFVFVNSDTDIYHIPFYVVQIRILLWPLLISQIWMLDNMDYPLLVSTPISDHMSLRLFVFSTTRTSHHRSDCLHECKDYKNYQDYMRRNKCTWICNSLGYYKSIPTCYTYTLACIYWNIMLFACLLRYKKNSFNCW